MQWFVKWRSNVSVTGGTPSYTYSWVDDATSTQVSTSQNLSGVGAGNYTLTVTDANYTATTTASITATMSINCGKEINQQIQVVAIVMMAVS
ncbi:MAG: hypothetical protein R2772_04115 [Chitinophagales bacterium]